MSIPIVKPEDCPEPYWHKTHHYCPACSYVSPESTAKLEASKKVKLCSCGHRESDHYAGADPLHTSCTDCDKEYNGLGPIGYGDGYGPCANQRSLPICEDSTHGEGTKLFQHHDPNCWTCRFRAALKEHGEKP